MALSTTLDVTNQFNANSGYIADLCDSLRYIVMSRPDYFEHPKLNMYVN